MNWVVFFVLLAFGLGNITGLALWLYQYTHEKHVAKWYKDKTFWLWVPYLIVAGSAYAVLRLILYIVDLIRK